MTFLRTELEQLLMLIRAKKQSFCMYITIGFISIVVVLWLRPKTKIIASSDTQVTGAVKNNSPSMNAVSFNLFSASRRYRAIYA